MNATVDLRRKQNLPNKKEYYLKYITDYFQTNKQDIIVKIIKNIDYMIQQHRIQIYLTDRPIHIESWLRKNHLTTIYNPELIYLRDSNIAYNKLDSFIRKYAELKDNNGKIVSQTSNDYLSV